MSETKYPRTLYKGHDAGTQKFVTNRTAYFYDSLLVNNEEEQKAAEEMGYVDSFHNALFGEVPKREKEEGVIKSDLPDEF